MSKKDKKLVKWKRRAEAAEAESQQRADLARRLFEERNDYRRQVSKAAPVVSGLVWRLKMSNTHVRMLLTILERDEHLSRVNAKDPTYWQDMEIECRAAVLEGEDWLASTEFAELLDGLYPGPDQAVPE